MAEGGDQSDKTEDPTQKRLDDARQRGDVAKSQEVNTWFMIAGGTLVLASFGGAIGHSITHPLRNLIAGAGTFPTDGMNLIALVWSLGGVLLAALGIPFVLLMLAAVVGNMVQHRPVWSAETMKPKISKLSPLAGAKRLFGKQAGMNFAKGLIKIVLLGAVMIAILWPQRHRLEAMVGFDPAMLLDVTHGLVLKILGAAVALLAVVAITDFLFQYRQWHQRQRMSVQDLKEEFRQAEGDPHVKGRLRQLRMLRMRKRMMAAVPQASVVIANPTHFAVALRYERGMAAPVCVAKGVDALALRIREKAAEHDIPVVENVPLARALHAVVEVDEEIPVEHYQAVAEVIGYVMRFRRRFSGDFAG